MPNMETGWLSPPPTMRTGTYLLPTRQTTGKSCHGLMAGRRNFPLYVPHIGSQRDIQQPATLRVSVESRNICIRPFLQKVTVSTSINDLNDYAKSQGITYAQLRDANPRLRDTSLRNKTGKTYTLYIPTQEGMYYDPKKQRPIINNG